MANATRSGLPVFEPHLKVSTLADLWAVSEDTVHRWLEEEEVLRCDNGRKDSPRIPASVAERVYAKHFKKRA